MFLGRLKSSSLVICLWPNELIVAGTVVDDDDDAKVGGNKGLQDECELTEVLVDVNGTPDDGYKSWLNCRPYRKNKKIADINMYNFSFYELFTLKIP